MWQNNVQCLKHLMVLGIEQKIGSFAPKKYEIRKNA
jgi:hypothetical protein